MFPFLRQRALKTTLLCAFLLIASIALSGFRKTFSELELFMGIRGLVIDNYVEIVDEDHMDEGAIRGLLVQTDRYNDLLSAKDIWPIAPSDTINGEAGFDIGWEGNMLTVISVMPDSPAEQVGLAPGDRILGIQGVNSFEHRFSVYEAQRFNYGPKGNTLKLNIYREGKEDAEDADEQTEYFTEVEMTYGELLPKEQKIDMREPRPGHAVFGIRAITSDKQIDALSAELKTLAQRDDLKQVVLDLRDDSRTSIEHGVALADLFVADGKDLGSLRSHQEQALALYKADDGHDFSKLPVTVLVNKGTAEGAEVATAILRDIADFPVAGEKTFGKITRHKVVDLKSGDRKLLILHATFYLPNAKEPIHAVGIEPTTTILGSRPDLIAAADTEETPATEEAEKGKDLMRILSRATKKDSQLDKLLNALQD